MPESTPAEPNPEPSDEALVDAERDEPHYAKLETSDRGPAAAGGSYGELLPCWGVASDPTLAALSVDAAAGTDLFGGRATKPAGSHTEEFDQPVIAVTFFDVLVSKVLDLLGPADSCADASLGPRPIFVYIKPTPAPTPEPTTGAPNSPPKMSNEGHALPSGRWRRSVELCGA